jgi:hypothetical protein
MPKGCLLVMMQPSPDFESEFNDWYDTDHVPERLAIPGFLAAKRYECVEGWPRYLAIYDLADPEVLTTPAYLAMAEGAYTNWTRRVLPRVRVLRHPLVQCHPGDALTTTAPRLLMIRFAGAGAGAEADLLGNLRELQRQIPEIAQIRLMAEGAHYLALIEARSPLLPGSISAPMFGSHAATIDLWNLYVAR